jgi:tetratricopeptide (TPR) repeat protein
MHQFGMNLEIRRASVQLVVGLLLFLGLVSISAQVEMAIVRGTVVGEDGKPLEGVQFRLRDTERGRDVVFVTDADGRFYRRGLLPSVYEMIVEKEGYRPVRDRLTLTPGIDRRMSFELARAAPPGAEEFAQGLEAFHQGNFEAAVQAFEAALAKSPNLPEIHINLALAYVRLSRPTDAVAALERAATVAPDTPRVLFQLGGAYLELNELDKAATALEKGLADVTQIDDEAYEATVALGAVYFARGDVDKAAIQFEKALSVRPDAATPKLGLGKVYASQGDLAKAIETFREVLKSATPSSPEAVEAAAFIEELERAETP